MRPGFTTFPVEPRRGATLVEVMIAGSVALLLLGLLARFLVPAMRYSTEGSIKVELQQQAVIAINQMVSALQDSAAQGVSFTDTAPIALGVVPIEDIDSNGQPVWSDELTVFYHDDTEDRLFKKTYPPTPPALPIAFASDRPPLVTRPQLSQIAGQPNASERSLARDVLEFEVSHQNGKGSTIFQPIILRLLLEKEVPHTERRARVELTRRVFLRNTL